MPRFSWLSSLTFTLELQALLLMCVQNRNDTPQQLNTKRWHSSRSSSHQRHCTISAESALELFNERCAGGEVSREKLGRTIPEIAR